MNSISFFEWCFCMLKHLLLFTFLYGGVWYASPSGWTLRQQHSKSGVGFSPRSAAPGSNLPLHGGLLSWENTILIYSEIVRERASEREGKRKVGERELIYEREKSCVCVFAPLLLLYRQLPTPGNPGMTQLPSGIQMQVYRLVPSGSFFGLPALSPMWVSVLSACVS